MIKHNQNESISKDMLYQYMDAEKEISYVKIGSEIILAKFVWTKLMTNYYKIMFYDEIYHAYPQPLDKTIRIIMKIIIFRKIQYIMICQSEFILVE